MAHRWSKERIVAAIQSRQKHDPLLRHVGRDDQGLYYAAFRFFGSWRNAVLAAGAKPYHRKWTKESIVEVIRARQEQGLPTRGITGKDPALYFTALRHFGNWPKAMLAAGLPWKPKQKLSREEVLAAICSRHQQGLPLRGVYKTDRALSYAARKYFGSWATAVVAAGVPDGWQRAWSRGRLIAVLQTCGEPGRPLASRQVPAAARRAAYEYFGSWHDALVAAGRTPLERVIKAIQSRHVKGLSVKIGRRQSPRLLAAANRHFGSWANAVAAAGIAQGVKTNRWAIERAVARAGGAAALQRGESSLSIVRAQPSQRRGGRRIFSNVAKPR